MKTPSLKNQSGQLIIEGVLIIVVLMAVTFAAGKYFKDKEVVKSVITGPFENLAGLLQNGVWGAPGKTASSHPNGHFRHIVIEGEAAK